MSMINIDDLHKEKNIKIEQRKEIYETILKKCHNKIISVSKVSNNLSCCFYEVPSYVYGLPLYDKQSCIMYLVNALVNNGFDVKYTHPNLLYVSWLGKTNNDNKTKAITYEKPKEKNYKEISDYKPKNNLIYNNNSIDNLTKKTSYLFK